MSEAPEIAAAQSRGLSHKRVETQGSYQETNVTDNGNRTLMWFAIIIAAFALGAMLWAIDEAKEAKRESSIATMRVEGMTRALIAHGIKDTYPHIPGEDD